MVEGHWKAKAARKERLRLLFFWQFSKKRNLPLGALSFSIGGRRGKRLIVYVGFREIIAFVDHSCLPRARRRVREAIAHVQTAAPRSVPFAGQGGKRHHFWRHGEDLNPKAGGGGFCDFEGFRRGNSKLANEGQ